MEVRQVEKSASRGRRKTAAWTTKDKTAGINNRRFNDLP
jgi:hypothetical protein